MKKIILSTGAGLIDDSIIFYPYHFVRTILSIPFCPIPFCPYHFVPYHFVLKPSYTHGRGSGSKNKFRFFSGKFSKHFAFSGNFTKNSPFQAKIDHLQLLLGKLFYFSSKVTTLEHTSCT